MVKIKPKSRIPGNQPLRVDEVDEVVLKTGIKPKSRDGNRAYIPLDASTNQHTISMVTSEAEPITRRVGWG